MSQTCARIRVLFAIGTMSGGGSERQVVELLKRLDRSRFTPSLYLVYRIGELLPEIPEDVPVFSFWDNHRQPRWNYPGRIHGWQVRHLSRVLSQHNVDVVYDRTLVMTLVSAPAAIRARVPFVSVAVADPEYDLKHQDSQFKWLKKRLLRKAYRRANQVVAVSEDLRQRLIEYYALAPDKVAVIRNPIDLARVDRLAAENAPEFQADRFHIVSAGRLQEQKGFVYLLAALHQLVNVRGRKQLLLHILGQGPQEQMLRSIVAERNLESHVSFEGFQSNPLPHFRAAHLVCLASIYEGLPNVLLEAMACRTPVLATDCPTGPRELLDDGRLGRLVPAANAVGLADAIDDALANYGEWLASVGAARAWVEDEFSVEAAVQNVAQVLSRSAQSGRS